MEKDRGDSGDDDKKHVHGVKRQRSTTAHAGNVPTTPALRQPHPRQEEEKGCHKNFLREFRKRHLAALMPLAQSGTKRMTKSGKTKRDAANIKRSNKAAAEAADTKGVPKTIAIPRCTPKAQSLSEVSQEIPSSADTSNKTKVAEASSAIPGHDETPFLNKEVEAPSTTTEKADWHLSTETISDLPKADREEKRKNGKGEVSPAAAVQDEGMEEDFNHLLQQTPPQQINDWLDLEATLVDSPKDRGVIVDESHTNTERLDFGYFAAGQSLFRNKLNDQELLEDGFVALHQLVLPDCQSALLTSFSGPSIQLVTQICWDVPKLLLVGHNLYEGSPFSPISMPDDNKNNSQQQEWQYIGCAPFGKHKQHLMHAKLLLFRSVKGLRIVISGNNLTTPQWTEDRDCFWVQDVPVAVSTSNGPAPNPISPTTNQSRSFDEPSMTRLKTFVRDLLKSSVAFHNISNRVDQELMEFVTGRIDDLFSNLDDAVVNNNSVRFVYSFPRMFKRGGWQQLCQAVWELRQKEREQRKEEIEANQLSDDDLWYDTDDDAESNDFGQKALEKLHLYASSGSFGDFYPNFLVQMRLAFSGNRGAIAKKNDVSDDREKKRTRRLLSKHLPWSEVQQVYCMWPSKATALMMNPIALLGRCRPMARKHWASLPSEARKSFFDAMPNPDGPSLVSSTESQAAAGFGRNLVPDIGGYRLRDGPLSAYTSFAHGKMIFGTTMTEAEIRKGSRLSSSNVDLPYAAVYVGSHNFSKKAWGVMDASPGNVEFGVVLLTTDPSQAGKWKARLPYQLPVQGSQPPKNYQPGRSWDLWERQQQTEEADESSVETSLEGRG